MQIWLIVIAIGLIVGFAMHIVMKYTKGALIIATLAGGVAGALIGAFGVAQYLAMGMDLLLSMRLIWAIVGAIVISVAVELLFINTRHEYPRGHTYHESNQH